MQQIQGDKVCLIEQYRERQREQEVENSKTELNILIGYGNTLSDKDAIEIGEELKQQTQLTSFSLVLYKTHTADGEYIKPIMRGISTLTNLQQLSLSIYDSRIQSEGTCDIGHIISNFTFLHSLNIAIGSENQIKSRGVEGLVKSFSTLTLLTQLHLSIGDNSIGQDGAVSIGQSFYHLTRLTSLYLSIEKNNSINLGAVEIGKGISHLILLEKLAINIGFDNYIGQDGMKSICQGMDNIARLQELSFTIGQNNHINSQGASYLANSFKTFLSLHSLQLNIYSNDIGSSGCNVIGKSLAFLTKLTTLQLTIGTNNITHLGAIGIGQGLQNLSQLSSLALKIGINNNIGSQGALGLSQGIQSLHNLTELNFNIAQGNDIQSVGVESIGQAFQSLLSLKLLSLNFGKNNIDLGFEELASSICYLKQLTHLEFIIDRSNYINLKTIKKLGQSLKSLKYLQNINLEVADPTTLYLIHLIKDLKLTPKNFQIKYLKDFTYSTNQHQINQSDESNEQINQSSEQINQQDEQIIATNEEINEALTLKIQINYDKNFDQISSKGLFQGLLQYENLTNLYMDFGQNNSIDVDGAINLADSLKQLVKLRDLYLILGYFNNIQKQGACQIGKSIEKLTQLSNLSLIVDSQNNIQSEGFKGLVDGFSNLKELKSLKFQVLNGNQFTSMDVIYLSKAIKQLNQLSILSLIFWDYQSIQDTDSIIILGESVSHLTQLRSLVFRPNHWSAFDPNKTFELCSFIFNLPLLRYLNLDVPSQYRKCVQKIIFHSKRLVVLK